MLGVSFDLICLDEITSKRHEGDCCEVDVEEYGTRISKIGKSTFFHNEIMIEKKEGQVNKVLSFFSVMKILSTDGSDWVVELFGSSFRSRDNHNCRKAFHESLLEHSTPQ